MVDKTTQTIRIKWVRSGIGFPRRQKTWVRSLGLKELNEVVERPDTPSIRGLVARAGHLVEIVEEAPGRASLLTPEYSVLPREVAVTQPAERTEEAAVASTEGSPVDAQSAQAPEVAPPAATEPPPAKEEEVAAAVPAASAEAKSRRAAEKPAAKKAKPKKDTEGKARKPAKEAAGKGAKAPKAGKK